MWSTSSKPIAIVALVISILWFVGKSGLDEGDQDDDLYIRGHQSSHRGSVSRFSGLRHPALKPHFRAGSKREHEKSALIVKLSSPTGSDGPQSARVTVFGAPSLKLKESTQGGVARFWNLPFNRTYQIEVLAQDSFPYCIEVVGPTHENKAVVVDIPFVARPLKLQMFGKNDRLLNHEWVVVDLFSTIDDIEIRHRIPTKGIDKGGYLALNLFCAGPGPLRIRFLQDEGKEQSLMTRAWLELPESADQDNRFDRIKLTRPPFFASGTIIQENGAELSFVRLRVLRLGSDDQWHNDSSMSTSTDYTGKWILRAELGVDLVRVELIHGQLEAREEFFLPRGLKDMQMRLYQRAELEPPTPTSD
ncbi:MAG: hypothetical protein ACI97A_000228 [Planctomycetota bacterium]|jgi:hypothetical protein